MKPVGRNERQLPPHLRGARPVDQADTRMIPTVTTDAFPPAAHYGPTGHRFSDLAHLPQNERRNEATKRFLANAQKQFNHMPYMLTYGALAVTILAGGAEATHILNVLPETIGPGISDQAIGIAVAGLSAMGELATWLIHGANHTSHSLRRNQQ